MRMRLSDTAFTLPLQYFRFSYLKRHVFALHRENVASLSFLFKTCHNLFVLHKENAVLLSFLLRPVPEFCCIVSVERVEIPCPFYLNLPQWIRGAFRLSWARTLFAGLLWEDISFHA